MDSKVRKTETDLSTLGSGVIVLGAWSFIKFVLSFLIYGSGLDESVTGAERVLTLVFIWLFAFMSFAIRFYIGRSARFESRGKRKRSFYLFLAGSVVFFESLEILLNVYALFVRPESFLSLFVMLIIEVTSAVIMIDLIANAVRIRRMRKKEAAV